MIRVGTEVFVDTGAWAALAVAGDPLHARALAAWEELEHQGALLRTSIPVVLETFTFLDRTTNRATALEWRTEIEKLERLSILPVGKGDLEASWPWLERRDLHKLSAVDATSFVVMKRTGIRHAFAFDHHFASAGFELVG